MAKKEDRSIPTGRLSRITRVAGLGAGLATELFSVAGRVVMGSDRDQASERFHKQTAEKLLTAFGRMKGLPMKAGQMITYLDEFIPSEHRQIYRDALAKLQSQARPIRWREMEAVVKADFQQSPQQLFASIDTEPVASASIGQVYRATLPDGTPVAVKIQYPGIDDAIRNDLKNVDVLKSAMTMILSRIDLSRTLQDLKDRILEETDYGCELCSHEEFRSLWQDDEEVIVPRIFADFSSDHVLTTEWVDGMSLEDFIEKADQPAKNRAGRAIFRFVFESLYSHGLVNADPHPGNALFFEDGRVGFIDYGCVQRYDREALVDYYKVRRMAVDGVRGEALTKQMLESYKLPEDCDEEELKFGEEFLDYCFLPVLENKPFKVEQKYMEKLSDLALKGSFMGVRKALRKGIRESKQPGFIYLNRIQFGVWSILARLNAEANWRAVMDDIDAKHFPEFHEGAGAR